MSENENCSEERLSIEVGEGMLIQQGTIFNKVVNDVNIIKVRDGMYYCENSESDF